MSEIIDWENIAPTRAAWSEVLEVLLERARKAATGTVRARIEVIEVLTDFIARSPAELSGGLDAMARATADELFSAAAEELLRSIGERQSALAVLRASLGDPQTTH
ncbi:hypothetical protein [Haliangium ochraceum]|uniref:Uncharacterized protein n=1 Tax=Haliangium ochraceum (strain DSM 14365 / JCM 11303 / SMP-2) TaxID=502025 RepID=D0LWT5_HALO1|nr:hypothetical protein [Haliangium ochraceum]ACY14182.1 hypothetical protein Hoch_1632 [Haliangium ochraceum DSM 14365]